MPKHTPSNIPTQLSLFDALAAITDERPLPLIVAEKWNFSLAYVDTDGNPDKYLYSAVEWLKGLGSTAQSWNYLKKQHNQLFKTVEKLPIKGKDGRKRPTDFIPAKSLYEIAARLNPNRRQPQLDEIVNYLTEAGVLVDKMRRNPSQAVEIGVALYQAQGKDELWIEERTQGMVVRSWFTSALQACLENPQPFHYAMATNEVYTGLWKRTAAQLKAAMGLPDHAVLRDYMTTIGLAYTRIAELTIAQKLGDEELLTWEQAKEIISIVARMIGSQAQETSQLMGVDLATGQRLLS